MQASHSMIMPIRLTLVSARKGTIRIPLGKAKPSAATTGSVKSHDAHSNG